MWKLKLKYLRSVDIELANEISTADRSQLGSSKDSDQAFACFRGDSKFFTNSNIHLDSRLIEWT